MYQIRFLKAINVQTSKMGFDFQFHTNLTKRQFNRCASLTSFQEYCFTKQLASFCSFSPIDFKLSLENELIFITKLHSFLMRRLWVDRTNTTIGHKIAGIYDCDRMEMSSFSFSIFRDFSVFFGFKIIPKNDLLKKIMKCSRTKISVNWAWTWFYFSPFVWSVKSKKDNFPHCSWFWVKKLLILEWVHMDSLEICEFSLNKN